MGHLALYMDIEFMRILGMRRRTASTVHRLLCAIYTYYDTTVGQIMVKILDRDIQKLATVECTYVQCAEGLEPSRVIKLVTSIK